MAQMIPVMAGIISAAAQTASTVQTVQGFAQDPYEQQRRELRSRQDLALKQLQDQQNLAFQQAISSSDQQKKEIKLDATLQEKNRRDSLKRAVSRQRAKFGSRGINSNSGSAEAVMLGLFEESEDEKKKRSQLDNLRFGALDKNLKNRNSLNILQATQLKQRQDLESLYQD